MFDWGELKVKSRNRYSFALETSWWYLPIPNLYPVQCCLYKLHATSGLICCSMRFVFYWGWIGSPSISMSRAFNRYTMMKFYNTHLTCQHLYLFIYFIYLGFYFAFNTVQVISRRVVGRAEETSTYSWSKSGTEPRPQRWEARVLPFCHCGPLSTLIIIAGNC